MITPVLRIFRAERTSLHPVGLCQPIAARRCLPGRAILPTATQSGRVPTTRCTATARTSREAHSGFTSYKGDQQGILQKKLRSPDRSDLARDAWFAPAPLLRIGQLRPGPALRLFASPQKPRGTALSPAVMAPILKSNPPRLVSRSTQD